METNYDQLKNQVSGLELLKNTESFVITGATGLLGSRLVDLLLELRKDRGFTYKIYALCRDELKLRETLEVKGEVIFHAYDMQEKINLNLSEPVIIHTASPTSTSMFVNQPSKVHELINSSTFFIKEFALKSRAKKLIQLSTMEVYGEQEENIEILETDNFGLDITNPRNCYPIAKIAAENYLLSNFKENALPVTILRLTQVMAPPIDYLDNRVIFQFARNIVEQEDIVMKTTGQTYRSYVYYLDVLSAILFAADQGQSGEVYNVSAPKSCVSIVELAERMIFLSESKIRIKFALESNTNTGYRDKLGLCIDSSKLERLGWKSICSLDESLTLLLSDVKSLQVK